MEKEITITIRKDDLRSAQYDDYAVWEWCKSKKIKVCEPRDTKTKLFETLVITLKTPEEKLLFSCKWFSALEKLSNVPSNWNKPAVSKSESIEGEDAVCKHISKQPTGSIHRNKCPKCGCTY